MTNKLIKKRFRPRYPISKRMPCILRYKTAVDNRLDYRSIVTIIELTVLGRETGRMWSEGFDPIRGNRSELTERFRKRILDGEPDVRPDSKEGFEILIRRVVKEVLVEELDQRGL